MEQKFSIYKRTTDVQQTWRQHGWTPPSKDPAVVAKWQFYRTLDTASGDNLNQHGVAS